MKIVFEESGILGFGICNTVQRIGNPSQYWNQESKFTDREWNPESKTDLDSLSSGERVISNMISMFFFFERASCFTNFFLVEALRKNKVFFIFRKSHGTVAIEVGNHQFTLSV